VCSSDYKHGHNSRKKFFQATTTQPQGKLSNFDFLATSTMKSILPWLLLLSCDLFSENGILPITGAAMASEQDHQQPRFFYENASNFEEQIMAPQDWDLVDCDDPTTCVSIVSIVHSPEDYTDVFGEYS
jgi:hypothetical protein